MTWLLLAIIFHFSRRLFFFFLVSQSQIKWNKKEHLEMKRKKELKHFVMFKFVRKVSVFFFAAKFFSLFRISL